MPTPITFEEMLQTVFPANGFVRLVNESGLDRFFRRAESGAWIGPDRARPARLDELVTTSAASPVRFSPVAWRAPASASAMGSSVCVWAGAAYRREANGHAPDTRGPDGSEGARARLLGAGWFPNVVLDEGDRLTTFWLLERPVADPAHLRSLLCRLAESLDADATLAEPATALVRVPGPHADGRGPGVGGVVEKCDRDRRYTVAEIERMIARGRDVPKG